MSGVLTATPAIARKRRLGPGDLRRFLNAYWLRPENGLWMALRSDALPPAPWRRPSIDLGCGDGCFSFLHAGGVFDDGFDVFAAVGGLEERGGRNVDIFDFPGERYAPAVTRRPGHGIDVGSDWKPNLLTKAGALPLYDELLVHDNNKPLPFDDESFETVYCNTAYWVRRIDEFLAEIRRITRPGGSVLLQVKLRAITAYTLEPFRSLLGEEFLWIIGRGRAECWPTLADRDTWEWRFQRAGLEIRRAVPLATRTHAQVWDVGLRPIAPLLIELANEVPPDVRRGVKRKWVDLFCGLCEPFFRRDFDLFGGGDEPAEISYDLAPV